MLGDEKIAIAAPKPSTPENSTKSADIELQTIQNTDDNLDQIQTESEHASETDSQTSGLTSEACRTREIMRKDLWKWCPFLAMIWAAGRS